MLFANFNKSFWGGVIKDMPEAKLDMLWTGLGRCGIECEGVFQRHLR